MIMQDSIQHRSKRFEIIFLRSVTMDSSSERKGTSVQSKIYGEIIKEARLIPNKKRKYNSENADYERPASRPTTFLQPSMAANSLGLNPPLVGFKCRTMAELALLTSCYAEWAR